MLYLMRNYVNFVSSSFPSISPSPPSAPSPPPPPPHPPPIYFPTRIILRFSWSLRLSHKRVYTIQTGDIKMVISLSLLAVEN